MTAFSYVVTGCFRRWEEWVYDVVGIFRAALNRVISDDSSNSSIVLGLHSGKNP